MRTTLDLPDPLLARAKRLARKRDTTLRALVEEGLRRVLEEDGASRYRLPDTSFAGDGLADGLVESDWSSIRARAYEGRGA